MMYFALAYWFKRYSTQYILPRTSSLSSPYNTFVANRHNSHIIL